MADPPVPLRLLMVEDSERDAEMELLALEAAGYDVHLRRVVSRAELEEALDEQTWDIVLADFSLPGFSGLEALRTVRERVGDLPFILISGTVGEDTAVEAMRAGADDYLLKDRLARLGPAVHRELREAESRRRRREQEKLYRALVQTLPDGVLLVDDQGAIAAANHQAAALLGYDHPDQLKGVCYADCVVSANGAPARQTLQQALEQGVVRAAQQRIRRRDGTQFPAEISASVLGDGGDRGTSVVTVIRDITERAHYEEQLVRQALYDDLTGLPNRTSLQNTLRSMLDGADQRHIAVLVLDLDGFRDINDTFGHEYGDLVLQHVAARLWNLTDDGAYVARMGGDEFAVLMPDTDAHRAVATARRIGRVLEESIAIHGQMLQIETCVGLALHPTHGRTASALLRRADAALFAAKANKPGYVLYSPESDQFNPERLNLLGELRGAMDDRQLVLYYQPKVSVKTGFVVGVEALVRWHHPTRRVLCPGSFIGLAEQTGLIRVLTPYILEEALSQCRAWQDQGIRLPVAVNLSARNLSDPSLTSTIERLLDRYGVDPRWLTLEVTESAMMLERAHVLEDLRRLHGAGIGVSIDDFGTGHSSLAYLSRLPVSELKIDQSFVTDMARNYHHSFIVRTITDLGHNLHLGVVAEGIENELTLGLLGAVGCDTVQGFHLCPPLPPSELEAWLTDRTIARSA